ncbi:alpha/beta fold hydrolase [Staphylococcus arlettae]|uniref:alpha/beta fold hydrolase n=1 Tax=Staphylococcus arlettae TaxID=29378 RepID=UPI001139D761|nr:alpha/beta hydrolase [Staphylococcus arlettae]BBK28968.1 lysophospholipase [Staphylococcus arlettae]
MNKILVNDDNEIAYTIEGQGIPVILIHALDGNMAAFCNLKNELKHNYKVITYDVVGHGYSSKPSTFTLDDHIEDLKILKERLNLFDAHVIGHDMGAIIAKGFADRYQNCVRTLTLISFDYTNGIHGLNKLMFEHEEEIIGFDKEEALIILFPYMYTARESAKKWVQKQRIYARQKPECSATATRAMMTFPTLDNEEIMGETTVPTLIINGKNDPLINHDYTENFASNNLNITVKLFAESGHAPHIEEPLHFLTAFNLFVESVKV